VYLDTRDVVGCRSDNVETAWDAIGLYNTDAKANAGVGGKKRYIYVSSSDFLIQLVSYANVIHILRFVC
jgi:hypothetical protein